MLQYYCWFVFSSAAEEKRVSRLLSADRVSRTPKQKPPHVATAVQTENLDHESDRDIESPWTVPDDIQRILKDTHDTLFQVRGLLVLGTL